jgi:hypothetical protein
LKRQSRAQAVEEARCHVCRSFRREPVKVTSSAVVAGGTTVTGTFEYIGLRGGIVEAEGHIYFPADFSGLPSLM